MLLAVFSVCIVLAEATISGSFPNMSVFSRVLHHTAQNQFLTELLTFLFLCYPCMCAYYAIYKLGRFNFYLLVPRYTSHMPNLLMHGQKMLVMLSGAWHAICTLHACEFCAAGSFACCVLRAVSACTFHSQLDCGCVHHAVATNLINTRSQPASSMLFLRCTATLQCYAECFAFT